MNKRYFIYVTVDNIFRSEAEPEYKILVYDYTGDVFHAIGEIMYRQSVKIQRITFNEWSEEREVFWNDRGIKIKKWIDKYSEREVVMVEKCKKCGHIKTGIAHKVFTSCAKYKHKTYNPTGLLNNYLLKMPRIIENEEDYARYLDDINYIPRLHNNYIDSIYKEVKINVEH